VTLRALIPLVVAFGFLMEQLDSTIIVTAIPDIAASLNTTPVRLNLAITGYVLSLAVFIPISGWIADRFGMRRVICAAFAIFTVSSAVCGLSDSLTTLVCTRVVQGIGGAMMTPVGRLILLRAFPKEQMVRAMTFVSLPALMGPTLGPLLGGVITTYASWRWIFYVNIPFGVLAIVLSWIAVSDERRASSGKFDFAGFVVVGVALALLQLVLETAGRGEVGVAVQSAMLAAGVGLLWLFALMARRRSNPVLDLSLFRLRTFRVGSLAGGLSRIGINAPTFLLPLLLQVGFGYSPVASGTLTFAVSAGAIAIRTVSVRLLRRLGFRSLLIANSLASSAMIAGFDLLHADTARWILLSYILVFGVVRSVQFNAMQTLSFSDMPPTRLSQGTSLGGVVQQLSMGLGVSVSAGLLSLAAGPGHNPSIADFHVAFAVIALLPLASLPGFISLRRADGAEVSGYRVREAPAGD
jgi:EmrB/QacA subfamily drug resistance transporter